MASEGQSNEHNSNQSKEFELEMFDISPDQDRSIMKRIVQPGTESIDFQTNDYVQFYLNIIQDRTKSIRERIRVNYLKFGSSDNYQDLEIALKSMQKGEIAEFCLSDGQHSGEPLRETAIANNQAGENEPNEVSQSGEPSEIIATGLLLKIELIGSFNEKVLKNKSNGVLRCRLKEGEGTNCPNEGATVNCHLSAYLLSGKKVEERDVDFCVGEGLHQNIPRGLELAVQQMKLFEKSRFLIQREYAFSSIPESLQSQIPSDYQELIYEIRLNKFTNAKDVWELSNEERLEYALKFKDKGNQYFKEQNWDMALKFYSKVVYYLGPPEDSFNCKANDSSEKAQVLLAGYLNLAQTYLKQDRPFDTIKNCNLALSIDANNVKAHFRKGLAHMKCKEFDLANSDFDRVLKLDPNNRSAQSESNACRAQLKKMKEKERNTFKNMFEKFAQIDVEREETARNKQKDIWKELQEESEFKTPEGDRFSDLPIKMIN